MKSLFTLSVCALSALSLAACGEHSLTAQEQMVAENGGMKYATAAGGTFVQCSGQDSNGDDYVTCSYKKPDGTIEEVVCSYMGTSAGCKRKE